LVEEFPKAYFCLLDVITDSQNFMGLISATADGETIRSADTRALQ